MAATIIPIKKSDGWLNLTSAATLNAGDKVNIQNIGSGAVYIASRELEPVNNNDLDYLLAPAKIISLTPQEVENIWAFTGGFRSTKLAVVKNELNVISDPAINNLNKTNALLVGVPIAGFKGFSAIGLTSITKIFAFHNNSGEAVKSDFHVHIANNANNLVGYLDIQVYFGADAITGGADFTAIEILAFRNDIDIIAKKEPTNAVSFAQFERAYVEANGGAELEAVSDFIIQPGETAFIKLTNAINIQEISFDARFRID